MKLFSKYYDLARMLMEYKFDFSSCNLKDLKCAICKEILKNATQSTCCCNFCLECIQNYLKEDSKVCPNNESCGGESISFEDIQIDHKVNRMIADLRVKCPFKECLYEDVVSNMDDHLRVCEKKETTCPYSRLGCVEIKTAIDRISEHLHDKEYYHGALVTESIENIMNDLVLIKEMKQEILSVKDLVKSLERRVEDQELEIEILKAEKVDLAKLVKSIINESFSAHVQNINNRMSKFNESINKINIKFTKSDDFIWKIEEFCQKQKRFIPLFKSEIISNPFYTQKYGYRLRLGIYPNGYGCGNKTHLFVSFSIMKGDFDDILEWPLKHVVNISLIDQNTGKDHTLKTFQYDKVSDDLKDVFDKPIAAINKSLGEDEFIKLDELNKHPGLLKNDTIIIRCYLTLKSF